MPSVVHARQLPCASAPALFALALTFAATACQRTADDPDPPQSTPSRPAAATSSRFVRSPIGAERTIRFTDVTDELGLHFTHDAGLDGSLHMAQIMGAGVALFDFDDDGDLDLYLLNGGPLPSTPASPSNALYRQDADGTFTDVTDGSGLADRGFAMGVAVGDIDNDADLDVYVSNYGDDVLYVNRGDGSFQDVTARAGIHSPNWSTSATFVDIDGDGWLDLYVTSYLAYDPADTCDGGLGNQVYCGPEAFPPAADHLYRNDGDGTFTDVSAASGINRPLGRGLGVAAADFDGDDDLDIYVANDGDPNQLLLNDGHGRFTDEGLLRGAAVNQHGRDEASMGVVVADLDGVSGPDIFLTHLTGETNTLYLNDGRGTFHDATVQSGIAVTSIPSTGFGAIAADFDHDGDLDIAVVNGTVIRDAIAAEGTGLEAGYGQPNQLFVNLGAGRFRDASDTAGDFAAAHEVSRGLAAGDIDGDGDIDLVVSNTSGRTRLLRNDSDSGRFLRVIPRYVSATTGAAIAARVVVTSDTSEQSRRIDPGGSYLSSSESVAHFGVDDASRVDLRVRWPDGSERVVTGVATDQIIELAPTGALVTRRGSSPLRAGQRPASAGRTMSAGGPQALTEASVLDDPLEGAEPQVRDLFAIARAAVESSPSVATWGRLGVLYHAHLRLDAALICYQIASRLEPRDARLPYLQAIILSNRAPDEAAALLAHVLTLTPQFIPAMVRRAELLRQLGDDEAAEQHFRSALALDPGSAAAHLGLGQVLAGRGLLAEALPHIEASVRAAPQRSEPLRELARILARLGRETEARDALRRVDALSDDHDLLIDPLLSTVLAENISVRSLLRRAANYRAAGQLQAALGELDRAIGFQPGNATLYNNRGLIHAGLDDLERALADLDRAITLAPDLVSAWINRAEIGARAGLTDQARADLQRSLRLDPGNTTARRRLQQLEQASH